ncbi:exodeoxyribonuclease VII large subunit, partial [Halalkalibacter lacteus]|uniref:exodeoxyribonuclease VII large subunit n=1 Tax=Halalkalibacter lacteus TaxID=3090663 RepID=UPI002FC62455
SHAFAFRTFWVVAEVTNHSFYSQKGFHYFDLVEKADRGSQILARMPAVAWSGGNIRIREFERITGQPFRNDIQVLVKVSVDYHPVYGLKLTL